MSQRLSLNIVFIGLTAVFVGYLTVWLPGPGAGLRFLGIELGEWVKFMGVGMERNWFYHPPISLALMLLALSLLGENGRWQTWVVRGLAVLISLLAFPALEDITGAVRHEYIPRVQWIGLVVTAVVLSGVLSWQMKRTAREGVCWFMLAFLGIVGAVQPTRVYLQIEPNVSQLLGVPIGFGWGVVLNGIGHLLVTSISLWYMVRLMRRDKLPFVKAVN